jgi:hypothetical protein
MGWSQADTLYLVGLILPSLLRPNSVTRGFFPIAGQHQSAGSQLWGNGKSREGRKVQLGNRLAIKVHRVVTPWLLPDDSFFFSSPG